MVATTGGKNQSCGGVLNRLELVDKQWRTKKHSAAAVKTWQH